MKTAEEGNIKKEIDDAKLESAYWAGRMIDMPDSRMAWDIANEIAQEINEWRTCFETEKLLVESYKKESAQAVADYKERLGAALIQLGYSDLLELMDDIADTTN
jgi:hypothetical protein